MDNIIEWRIYCITEDLWSIGWKKESEGIPTCCFNNNSHNVNVNSQQEISKTAITTVKIQQETTNTGGNIKYKGYKFIAPPNEVTTVHLSWEYPINIMRAFVNTDISELGNILDVIVSPKTIIGIITQNVVSGTKNITISESAIVYCKIGHECFINNDFIGIIIAVDEETFTITLKDIISNNYSIGDLFKIQRRIIEDYNLGYPETSAVGGASMVGKYLPKNTQVEIKYTNNKNTQQPFCFSVEYLH